MLELQVKTFQWWVSVIGAFAVISFLKVTLGFSSLLLHSGQLANAVLQTVLLLVQFICCPWCWLA